MSTADATVASGQDLAEVRPEDADHGRPHAQRERDAEEGPAGARVFALERSAMLVGVALLVGLQAAWLGFLSYLAHRLFLT